MKLYDSDPSGYSKEPISSFYGDKFAHEDRTIYTSFKKAREAGIRLLEYQIKTRQERLGRLKDCTVQTCPSGINPFTDI